MTDGGKKKSNLIQEASKNSSWQLNFFQSFIRRIQNRSRFPLTFYGDQHATDLQSSEHWHLEYEHQAHQERRLGLYYVPPDGSDIRLFMFFNWRHSVGRVQEKFIILQALPSLENVRLHAPRGFDLWNVCMLKINLPILDKLKKSMIWNENGMQESCFVACVSWGNVDALRSTRLASSLQKDKFYQNIA